MSRLTIREAVVVEGRYDKHAVSQVVDTLVIETEGFGIFSQPEKRELLRRMQETRGLIILTDSDGAGFLIRGHLKGMLPPGVKHAYIPDVAGKERRKAHASKAGLIGVEGMPPELLRKALLQAGATALDGDAAIVQSAGLTMADLYADGLSGRPGSQAMRAALLASLDLPARMTAGAMLAALNLLLTWEEYDNAVRELV